MWTKLFLLAFLGACPSLSQVITLEQYNIDPSTITVSGLSAGGAMATQYHVIHSDQIMGAGIFAGIVYHCANGLLSEALLCMDAPYLTNVNTLIDKTNSLASEGSIDPVSGMSGDKVYIFEGTKDTVVFPGNGPNIEEFYQAFGADITTEFTIAAEHCQPTDNYGPQCDYLGGEYINDCDYNGAYEALNFMYGNTLTRPAETIPLNGQLSQFDQTEFFPLNDAGAYSMADAGYIYIASGCINKNQTCQLHFVFHGCEQGSEYLDDTFVTETGYLQVAEANNFIVAFPQIIHELLANPNGCFDWWGYTGALKYAKYEGPQIQGIYDMIDRLVNG